MKRTTISRQLLVNFLVPMIVSISVFSFISYRYNIAQLEEYYTEQKLLITDEVKSLLSFYDYSMTVHEENFSERMKEFSDILVHQKFNDSLDPATTNLFTLAASIGMDTTTEFIYIINRSGVVINTTFRKDQGLDFYSIDDHFKTFFEKIFSEKKYVEDRFSFERNTGSIKKYSYQPSLSGDYIIEIGFYSSKAIELKSLLEKEVESISQQYSYIRNIKLIMATKIKGDVVQDDRFQDIVERVIDSRKNERMEEGEGKEKRFFDFIYLPIMKSSLFEGYVILMESDDSKRKELISNEIKKFGIIFLLTVIPVVLIVILRSRKITRPIIKLTGKAAVISSGNLNERVEVEGRNEITELSESFNTMVEKLQESYNTLEQKVIDRTRELQHQKEIVEEKQKEIVDSINYASRIQNAILPEEKDFTSLFREAFVLFKPKDIVSGDFYWICQKNDFIFYATADCTGHGVPGGFMSMLGSSFLNEIVMEKSSCEPSTILNELRDKVIAALKQTGNVGENKDGMDIVLTRFDLKNKKLVYASANNDFYIIRNQQLLVFKPDKQPIGYYSDNMKSFTQHEIALEDGDCIYTFTDGFADQFGGAKGKKLKYKVMEELLVKNHLLSFSEQQKTYDRFIEGWKGELEQNDDICLIGIKI